MVLFIILEFIPHIIGKYDYTGVLLRSTSAVVFFYALTRLTDRKISTSRRLPFIAMISGFILHSIPTGFSIGVTSAIDGILAMKQLKGMFIHHLGEGVGIAGLLFKQGNEVRFASAGASVIVITLVFYFSVLAGTNYQVNEHIANWVVGVALGSLIYALMHLFET
jgi:zinc transporter ZupT